MMVNQINPNGWGGDDMTRFLDNAHGNSLATFASNKPAFEHLLLISNAFKKFIEVSNPPEFLPALFLLQAHSTYMSGVGLAMSAQLPASFMVMRGCLETSLYGFYIFKKPGLASVWLERDLDKESQKRVSNAFRIGDIFGELAKCDARLEQISRSLYELSISRGGHPNNQAVLSGMQRTEAESRMQYNLNYLDTDPMHMSLCLRTAAQIGVCSLSLFQKVFELRFNLLGLTAEILRLSKEFIVEIEGQKYTMPF